MNTKQDQSIQQFSTSSAAEGLLEASTDEREFTIHKGIVDGKSKYYAKDSGGTKYYDGDEILIKYENNDEHDKVKIVFESKVAGDKLKAIGTTNTCNRLGRSPNAGTIVYVLCTIPPALPNRDNTCEFEWNLDPHTPRFKVDIKLKRKSP